MKLIIVLAIISVLASVLPVQADCPAGCNSKCFHGTGNCSPGPENGCLYSGCYTSGSGWCNDSPCGVIVLTASGMTIEPCSKATESICRPLANQWQPDFLVTASLK